MERMYRKGDKVRLVGRKWSERGAVYTVTRDQTDSEHLYLDKGPLRVPWYIWDGWEVELVEEALTDWEIEPLVYPDEGTIFNKICREHRIVPGVAA